MENAWEPTLLRARSHCSSEPLLQIRTRILFRAIQAKVYASTAAQFAIQSEHISLITMFQRLLSVCIFTAAVHRIFSIFGINGKNYY